jgi:hypothetical protein
VRRAVRVAGVHLAGDAVVEVDGKVQPLRLGPDRLVQRVVEGGAVGTRVGHDAHRVQFGAGAADLSHGGVDVVGRDDGVELEARGLIGAELVQPVVEGAADGDGGAGRVGGGAA